jgi:hypothetical protein
VRFEGAENKNIVMLTNVPWGCDCALLLRFINNTLLPLNVQLAHPPCTVLNKTVFLLLANFYEALEARNLLHLSIFEVHYSQCRTSASVLNSTTVPQPQSIEIGTV